MKRILSMLLIFLMYVSTFDSIVCADDSGYLPTIDEVLQTMTAESGRTRVSDDLSEYDPDNMGEFDFNDLKIVILERRAPEKDFSACDSGYPLHYVSELPDDYQGVDLGTSQVWLRCDLMNRLPKYMRATSLDTADLILIAETQYALAGTVSVSTYKETDNENLPEFDTIEEMTAYINSHRPIVEKITLYPKFAVLTLLNLYSPTTKKCEVYDYTVSLPVRFAKKPEAQDFWDEMEILSTIIRCIEDGERESIDLDELFSELERFIPEEKTTLWKTCLENEEYLTTAFSMREYYWSMAKELMELDNDPNHQGNYKLIIDAKDMNALAGFVDFCEYSGFDKSIEMIRLSKEYLGTPDYKWLEDSLNAFVEMLTS